MKAKNLLKKAFLLLALIGGASSAWGSTELVYYGATGVTVSGTTATTTSGITISQTNSKSLTNGGNITIASQNRQSFKLSTGSRNLTFTAPKNSEITSITVYSYVNDTEVGGSWTVTSGTELSSTAGTAFATDKNHTTTPDVQTFVFAPASSIGLSWTGKQLCAVFQIEYFSTTTSKFTLTPAANPAAGASSLSAARSYYAGSTAYLKTVAADGYIFNNWKNGDDVVSTDPECFVTMPAAASTYTANFSAGTSYTITGAITGGQSTWGSITNSGDNIVVEDEEITFAATANTGYSFLKWQKDGVDYSTDASITVTSTADATYTAFFKQLYTINFNVEAANKGTASTGLEVQYANGSDKWTAPQNYYTASEGKTLTAWSDGVNNYIPGTEYTLTGNITISPVYTANAKYLSDLTAETTVDWTFARSAGAPTLDSQNNTQYYVQRTTIAENSVDVPIFVNTVNNYGISGKNGKFNNSGNEGYAQVNNGTVFKIPAVQGMVVKYMTNQTTAVGNIGFTDNTENLGGDGTALTTPTVISVDNKTISYTYTGTASYLYLVDKVGGKYPTGISVTYPEKKTKYLAPTITVGDFSFADKAYPVTITAVEGTLYVSTDGENYTVQTSPYEVNVTTTTHFYAKATGASYDDSEVVDENVTNTFDGGKSYVAWVYESNYTNAPSNYNVANDEIFKALNAIYNVVLVDIKNYKSSISDEQKTALNGNLDDADLVVISEAVAGSSKAVIALKDIIGTVPMLNTKLYAYTYNSDASKNRWGWGSPADVGAGDTDANVSIIPSSVCYKVLNGVIITDGAIKLFDYPNNQKHIQYVNSWTSEPENDVVLATASSKPVMHASNSLKYFALGLSCDDFTKYNANAVAIVKNAAAMLIAGENLDAEQASTTITAAGWATYCSPYALDLEHATGLTDAYIVTGATGNVLNTTSVKGGTIPANTGILIEAPEGTVTIPVVASSETNVSANKLVGVTAATEIAAEAGYVLMASPSLGFYKNANAFTVGANTAYLPANIAAGAARSAFFFGGNITAVDNVEAAAKVKAMPVKRIVNGKLVIENEGDIFNAFGQKLSK